jgi:hypothetical protein
MNVAVDQSQTIGSTRVPAVAFTKSKRAQSTTDDETWVPGEVSPTMSCFDQGDTRATTVVAFDILGTPATNAAKTTDVHVPLRARQPGQSEASTTTVVAQGFTYSGYSNQPAWMTGDRTDCLPASGHGDSSHQGMGVLAFAQNQLGEVRTNSDIMGTVNTNQNASERNTPMVAIAFDGGNQSASDDVHHTLRIGRDSGDAVMAYGLSTTVTPKFAEELSPTIATPSPSGGGQPQCVAFRENQRGEVEYVDPPHALASGGGKPGQGYCGVQQAMSVRRLTPRECERLQGFPDDYTLVTYRNKAAADGPRYKALGNSMAVPVMRWIGERIASVDSLDGAT